MAGHSSRRKKNVDRMRLESASNLLWICIALSDDGDEGRSSFKYRSIIISIVKKMHPYLSVYDGQQGTELRWRLNADHQVHKQLCDTKEVFVLQCRHTSLMAREMHCDEMRKDATCGAGETTRHIVPMKQEVRERGLDQRALDKGSEHHTSRGCTYVCMYPCDHHTRGYLGYGLERRLCVA